MSLNIITWIIAAVSIAGVIIRPFRISEAIWAVGGAIVLLLTQVLQPIDAWHGITSGTDVYLFLVGMMLLAEVAREEKLFDWLAAHAALAAKGSPRRLFMLIYGVGIIVTIFLSNDATAVVLTPAVAAAMKAAKVKNPLPYLFICAFIANAASFVLPISNPANLVLYADHMPALLQWLPMYFLPSLVSIIVTFFILRATQLKALQATIETTMAVPVLPAAGKTAAYGIIATAFVLLLCSGFDIALGLPTAVTGIVTAVIVLIKSKKMPAYIIHGVSWAVLPMVAGLFVIVEALQKTGLTATLATMLERHVAKSVNETAWIAGLIAAYGSNLTNNLPSGLIAGHTLQIGHTPEIVRRAVLVGIDLGPNLSITGSLATLLWLVALRREGLEVSAWQFLKLGTVVMTMALLATLATLWL